MIHTKSVLAVVLSVLAAPAARGENWPHWRGPTADGVSREENLPAAWGPKANVRFRAPLEGLGTSTPVVYGDLVFLTYQLGMGPIDGRGAEFPEAERARSNEPSRTGVTFVVQAHRREDGRIAWAHRFEAIDPKEALPSVHPKHNLASPSVVTDGEHVFAWMGTGQVVALGLEGKLAWERHLGAEFGAFDVLWGHGSSPMLHGDRLFLLVDHPSRAYLLALDKRTGREIWRVDRGEGLRSYSTPFLVPGSDGEELVVNSSHRIESYDPDEGKLLWHAGDAVTLAIPMPVHDRGVLYASRGYSSGPYSAIRVGGRGDVSETRVLWSVPTSAPYISSLVFYEGLLYMATENGIASVIDAGSGKLLWRERLGGAFTASPVAGDGKVYLVNESGETFVLRSGRSPEVLARNALGERTLASPAVSGGTLFFRTDHHLVAIGKAAATERSRDFSTARAPRGSYPR